MKPIDNRSPVTMSSPSRTMTLPSAQEESSAGSRGWVLVVDDDGPVRNCVRHMLTAGGFDVLDAGSLQLAGASYAHHDVRVLVYDLILPDQEMTVGLEEARVLFPGARILAVSGGGRLGPLSLLRAAKKLGATATLAKPFECQHLLSVVRDLYGD